MFRRFLITAVVLLAIVITGCTSNGVPEAQDTQSPNPPDVTGSVDLSGLNASETEAEIIRLLREGYFMYTRTRVFPGTRIPGLPCRTAQVICDTYPETTIDESWGSADSSGLLRASYARKSNEDGRILATATLGSWTDLATGEQWSSGDPTDSDLIAYTRGMFTKIERENMRGLSSVDGEILGRPSVVFPEGEWEYQVANPLVQRQTRWQDDGNGGREIVSEFRVLHFAMLPPDSMPNFAAERR